MAPCPLKVVSSVLTATTFYFVLTCVHILIIDAVVIMIIDHAVLLLKLLGLRPLEKTTGWWKQLFSAPFH